MSILLKRPVDQCVNGETGAVKSSIGCQNLVPAQIMFTSD